MDYQDINAKTIDRWIEEGWEWGRPLSHEDYLKATQGIWDVLLTPTKKVPRDWFGDLKGKKILGLASGGGQQMPVFASKCTDNATFLPANGFVLENSSSNIRSRSQLRFTHSIFFSPDSARLMSLIILSMFLPPTEFIIFQPNFY